MNHSYSVGLIDALGVGSGDLISLVGGGGKTTLMYRLTAALHEAGLRVAAATTTKIAPPEPTDPCSLLLATDYTSLCRQLAAVPRPAVLGQTKLNPQKIAGIPPEWCERLLQESRVDCLVVEADGAARKPLKAPEDWEPVVPTATTLFVAVVGLSCLGKPLHSDFVFRPELIAQITELSANAPITPSAVARLLASPRGLHKGCPEKARAVVLLNQADTAEAVEEARTIAIELTGSKCFERILTAALGREKTVKELLRL